MGVVVGIDKMSFSLYFVWDDDDEGTARAGLGYLLCSTCGNAALTKQLHVKAKVYEAIIVFPNL